MYLQVQVLISMHESTPWPQFAILCTVLLEIFQIIHENFTLEMFTYQKVQLMIRTDS